MWGGGGVRKATKHAAKRVGGPAIYNRWCSSNTYMITSAAEVDYRILAGRVVDEYYYKKEKKAFDSTGLEEAKFLLQQRMEAESKQVIGPFYGAECRRPAYIALETRRKKQRADEAEFLKYFIQQWGIRNNCAIPDEVIEQVPAFHAELLAHVSESRYPITHTLKCVQRLPAKTLADAVSD